MTMMMMAADGIENDDNYENHHEDDLDVDPDVDHHHHDHDRDEHLFEELLVLWGAHDQYHDLDETNEYNDDNHRRDNDLVDDDNHNDHHHRHHDVHLFQKRVLWGALSSQRGLIAS